MADPTTPEGAAPVPAALPAPAPAGLNHTYRAAWYNPWVRAIVTDGDTGEVRDLSRDLLSVDTAKSLADPAGTWSVTLVHRRFPVGGRNVTWADLIREQDYVEIRMGNWYGDRGVTVMRGFVDNCHRVDAVDPERGLPNERVLLSGRDYGKLWLNFQVFYLQELGQYSGTQAANLLARYWGIDPALFTPTSFLNTIYGKLVAPKLERLRASNSAVVAPQVRCTIPDQFQINGKNTNFQAYTGSIWNVMAMYNSQPYTEFLVRDVPGEQFPEINWRWAPLAKLGNRLALPWTPHPRVSTLHADDLSNYDVSSSDNQKYTYFWAQPGQYGSVTTGLATGKQIAPGYIDGGAHGIDKYGYKDLQPPFNMYAFSSSGDLADDDSKKTESLWVPQIKTLTQWLADVMMPNDLFLGGNIQTHLRPDITVGEYVDVPEEGTRFYVESVSHSLLVGDSVRASTVFAVSRGQRLGDRDVATPATYKYTEGAQIPGGSLHGANPSRAEAETADKTAGGDPASDPAQPGTPALPPTPPAQGTVNPEGRAGILQVAGELVGVAWYRSPGRNWDRATKAEAFAAITRPFDDGGGLDCSELSAYAYKFGAGFNLPPPAQAQFDMSARVALADLIPGDLCFFGGTTGGPVSASNITHVGIYEGDGVMVNAQDYNQTVKAATITSGYWFDHFVSGGRVFT